MFLYNWQTLQSKYLRIFLQSILIVLFSSNTFADPTCKESITPLLKSTNKVQLNGGLWEYFEKDTFLQKHSAEAIQLESRINKIFFTLNYLCETQDGIPFNDLATYLSQSISKKGEVAFKAELITLGKTTQQIKNWFDFFKYAQSHRFRSLDSSLIQSTINRSIPLINNYTSMTKNIDHAKSSQSLFKKTRKLIDQIDAFLSTDPYITKALDEISHVPYWDINESSGGS